MLLFCAGINNFKKTFEYSFTGIFPLWYIENKKNGSKKRSRKKEVMMVTGAERTDNHRKRYNSGSVPVITTRWN